MQKGGEYLLPSSVVPDTFTLEDAGEDQAMLRGEVAKFVRKCVVPSIPALENHATNAAASRELLKQSAELGLLGLEIPEEYGGAALDPVTATLALERLGEYGSWACTIAAHAGIGTQPLYFFGTEAQKEKYLAKLVSGEWPAAYALTEAKAGSNPAAMEMTATPAPGGWVLNGTKQFITNAGFAELFTMYAKLPDDSEDQFTAFLVERSWPGVEVGTEERKIGIWGSSTASVKLVNVFVPDGNLLGAPHMGKKIALNILNLGRFKLGVVCLGAARECLRMATAYSRGRPQFGQNIIEFGLVRNRLAGMAARVAGMEAIVYRTARLLEHALSTVTPGDTAGALKAIGEYAMECSIVKVYCSEALFWIAAQNVKAHGGNGFTLDYGAAKFFLDAIINEIFEGTNDINRLLIFEMFFRRRILPRAFKSSGFWTRVNRLDNAKRSVLVSVGRQLFRHRKDIANHQIIMGAASDCFIDLFVLDSVQAAQAKHPTAFREAALELLMSELLPAIVHRAGDLSAARERIVNDIVGGLPE